MAHKVTSKRLIIVTKIKKRKKKVRIYCRDKWEEAVHQANAFVLCNEGKNGSALPFFFNSNLLHMGYLFKTNRKIF